MRPAPHRNPRGGDGFQVPGGRDRMALRRTAGTNRPHGTDQAMFDGNMA